MEPATSPVKTDHFDPPEPAVPLLFWVYSPERQIVEERPHELISGVTGIGREPGRGARLVLSGDRGLSRQHAQIEYDVARQTVTLRDSSSKQSTWVNGQRLSGESMPLAHGDVIRLGDSIVVLSLAPKATGEQQDSKLLGRSPFLAQLRASLARLAKAQLPVLLLGEPGTGKERAAQELHMLSGRSKLIAQDCGALTATLAESTLFGHRKGAFSGATQDRDGLFRSAHGGTLFLDEVGNLSEGLQQKLLRVLAERKVHALGAEEKPGFEFDVLLVAATNRPIVQDTKAGTFRLDLFRRIAGAMLTLPPLRIRREDILYLLQHVPGTKDTAPPALPQLHTSQVELLLLHDWPGNVGDLVNVRGHICSLGFDDNLRARLGSSTIPQSVMPASAAASRANGDELTAKEPRPDAKRLEELLRKHQGKLLPIEKETGWSRRTLRTWVTEYKLEHLRRKEE